MNPLERVGDPFGLVSPRPPTDGGARAERAAAFGSTGRGGRSQTQVAAQVPRPLRPPEAAARAADVEPRDWLHRGNPTNLLVDPNIGFVELFECLRWLCMEARFRWIILQFLDSAIWVAKHFD